MVNSYSDVSGLTPEDQAIVAELRAAFDRVMSEPETGRPLQKGKQDFGIGLRPDGDLHTVERTDES